MHRMAARHKAKSESELELIQNTGEAVRCALVLMSDWRTKLPELLA